MTSYCAYLYVIRSSNSTLCSRDFFMFTHVAPTHSFKFLSVTAPQFPYLFFCWCESFRLFPVLLYYKWWCCEHSFFPFYLLFSKSDPSRVQHYTDSVSNGLSRKVALESSPNPQLFPWARGTFPGWCWLCPVCHLCCSPFCTHKHISRLDSTEFRFEHKHLPF